MEVGEEGIYIIYTYRYTVTARMTPVLRLASMRAILCFINCEGQSHKTMSTDQLLKKKDSRGGFEPRSLCLSASHLNLRGTADYFKIFFFLSHSVWDIPRAKLRF